MRFLKGRGAYVVGGVVVALLWCATAALGQTEPPAATESEEAAEAEAPYPQFPMPEDPGLRPPQDVEIVDFPDDEGNCLLLNWEPSPDDSAPARPREFFDLKRGEFRFMSAAHKQQRREEWDAAAAEANKRERSGYVIRRKPTSQAEFLWEPNGETGPVFSPVIVLPGFRQYQDNDFQFLVPIGEDSVLRGESPPTPEELLEMREEQSLLDPRLTRWDYEIRYFEDGRMSEPVVMANTGPRGNYYNRKWTNVLLMGLVSSILIISFIFSARSGRELYVRPVAGLQAVDDAVGRATEMGRPILFSAGFAGVDNISTIAAMVILGRIARIAAQHGTKIIVPCLDPVVMTALREVVREAYVSVGRPEDYEEDRIFYLTGAQFAYAAGMAGIMVREKTAANFYMGYYYAESLILAETGFMAGSIQIVGTDSYTQLPFFIVACDYTLMGEEFFGASAYLSREPKLLGSLKGQDYSKLLIAVFMTAAILVATVAGLAGADGIAEWTQQLFQYASS